MKISIKKEEQIQKMRIAGKLASEVLEMIEPFVVPGVQRLDIGEQRRDATPQIAFHVTIPLLGCALTGI